MPARGEAPSRARQGGCPTLIFHEYIKMHVFFLNILSGHTLKTDFVWRSYACFSKYYTKSTSKRKHDLDRVVGGGVMAWSCQMDKRWEARWQPIGEMWIFDRTWERERSVNQQLLRIRRMKRFSAHKRITRNVYRYISPKIIYRIFVSELLLNKQYRMWYMY
jgi:hypothetical protein